MYDVECVLYDLLCKFKCEKGVKVDLCYVCCLFSVDEWYYLIVFVMYVLLNFGIVGEDCVYFYCFVGEIGLCLNEICMLVWNVFDLNGELFSVIVCVVYVKNGEFCFVFLWFDFCE